MTFKATTLALLLLVTVSVPVQADHDPVHTILDLLRQDGVPAVFNAAVVIYGDETGVDRVYTSPGAECIIDDDPFYRFIDVECRPPSYIGGVNWLCLGPMLRVDIIDPLEEGHGDGSVTGYAGCDDVLRSCTAYGHAYGGNGPSCMETGVNIQPLPFRCQADYAGAVGIGDWVVTCYNGDP